MGSLDVNPHTFVTPVWRSLGSVGASIGDPDMKVWCWYTIFCSFGSRGHNPIGTQDVELWLFAQKMRTGRKWLMQWSNTAVVSPKILCGGEGNSLEDVGMILSD